MRKIFFLLFSFGISSNFFAQNVKAKVDDIVSQVEKMGDSLPNRAVQMSIDCYVLASEIKYDNGMISSSLLASRNFFEVENFAKTAEYAIRAEKFSIKTNNFYGMTEAKRLKGRSYRGLGFFDQSKIEFYEALMIAKKINNKDDRNKEFGLIYNGIGETFFNNKESIDSIGKYFKLSYKEFEKISDEKIRGINLSHASVNIGSYYLLMKDYDNAEKYMEKAIDFGEKYNYRSSQLRAYVNLAKLEIAKQNYSDAIEAGENALILARKLRRAQTVKRAYILLYQTHFRDGNIEEYQKYLKKYEKISDSLDRAVTNDIEISATSVIQEHEDDEMDTIHNLSFVVLILIILVCVLLFVDIYFLKKIKTSKKEAFGLIRKLIIKRKKIELLKSNNQSNIEDLIVMAEKNSDDFLDKFKFHYPDFYDSLLKNKVDLSESDVKICAFVKLGFSVKDIAIFTDVTVRSIESKIYRIRKKLNIPSDVDFDSWILNL